MNTLSEKAERFSLLPLLPTHPPLKHLKSPQIERAWKLFGAGHLDATFYS